MPPDLRLLWFPLARLKLMLPQVPHHPNNNIPPQGLQQAIDAKHNSPPYSLPRSLFFPNHSQPPRSQSKRPVPAFALPGPQAAKSVRFCIHRLVTAFNHTAWAQLSAGGPDRFPRVPQDICPVIMRSCGVSRPDGRNMPVVTVTFSRLCRSCASIGTGSPALSKLDRNSIATACLHTCFTLCWCVAVKRLAQHEQVRYVLLAAG
jgi:hypothetical protein